MYSYMPGTVIVNIKKWQKLQYYKNDMKFVIVDSLGGTFMQFVYNN